MMMDEFLGILVSNVIPLSMVIMLFWVMSRREGDTRRLLSEVVRMSQQAVERQASESTSEEDPSTSRTDGAYVFVEVPDEYKSLFQDAMKGFEEYAQLKGYRVSVSVDAAQPGKVGLKFTIMERGVTVTTSAVRADVDEYIAKLNRSETFVDLPIVADPVEHERLTAALATRFTMIKHTAEIYKIKADTYERFLTHMSKLGPGGMGYVQTPAIIHNRIEQSGSQMAGSKYLAEHSPGAAVGNANTSVLTAGTVVVGSTVGEKNAQLAGLNRLLELVQKGDLEQKDDAVRYLTNVKEEITDGDPPDTGIIGQFLGKAKEILFAAREGTELCSVAKEVLKQFGMGIGAS